MGTGHFDGGLIGIIRDRLEVALRDREVVAVSALRSGLAAIGNAEAVRPDRVPAALRVRCQARTRSEQPTRALGTIARPPSKGHAATRNRPEARGAPRRHRALDRAT